MGGRAIVALSFVQLSRTILNGLSFGVVVSIVTIHISSVSPGELLQPTRAKILDVAAGRVTVGKWDNGPGGLTPPSGLKDTQPR